MRHWSAILLVFVLLFQLSSKTIILLHYELNKWEITRNYCVNRSNAALHCNGKCHLKKQLEADNALSSKAPAAPFKNKIVEAPAEALLSAFPHIAVPAGAGVAITAHQAGLCCAAFRRAPERPPSLLS